MNDYDKELSKTTPSMIKGIAVQAEQLKGNQNASLSFDDVCGIVNFGLALGCQINEAEKVSTTKLTIECVIGGILFGCFFGLLAANIANRAEQKKRITYQPQPVQLPVLDNGELEAKMAELERMYQQKSSVFINT